MWNDRFEAAAKKLELTATLVNLESQVELKRIGTNEKNQRQKALFTGSQHT